MARIVGDNTLAEGCDGKVRVEHGKVRTVVRGPGEPVPSKREFNWSSMTADRAGGREYTGITWTHEDVCGRDPIEPRQGEVLYDTNRPIVTAKDGSRHTAYIEGDDRSIASVRAGQAIMNLIDASYDLEDAENRGDDDGARRAEDIIKSYGFDRPVIAQSDNDGRKEF